MEIQRVRQILRSYLSGNSTSKEKQTIDNWYQSFESEEEKSFSKNEDDLLKYEVWSRIEPLIVKKAPFSLSLLPVLLRIAASIILISGVTWMLVHNFNGVENPASLFSEIYTRPGERKNVTMTDGTQLVLNSGTHIRIRTDFSKERRLEILDGEVYFDVKRDPSRPFIIKSGTMTTRVLGTAFNITAYSGVSKMTVGVVRGKVSVSPKGKAIQVLEKNDQLTYNKKENTFKVGAADPGLLSWKEGKLILNDVSFDDMSILVEKNFGIKVRDSARGLNTNRYTTELMTTMKPKKVIEVLAAIHNLKIKENGNIFYLSK